MFVDVLTHSCKGIIEDNIIIDITEQGIDDFIVENSKELSKLILLGGEEDMQFDNIKDITSFLLFLRDKNEIDECLYKDFTWFSTNKYTTSSEYFGELMLFLESIADSDSMKKDRDEILKLINILQGYFE